MRGITASRNSPQASSSSATAMATASPRPLPAPRPPSLLQRRAAAAPATTTSAVRATRGHRRSATTRAAASDTSSSATTQTNRPRVVVVGGGWAGFGAARALAKSGAVDVTLLEGAPNPGGVSGGYRDARGRSLELGMKGFWYNYPSVYGLLRELSEEKRAQEPTAPLFRAPGDFPLTDYTTSGFWGRNGRLITCAPVFSKSEPFNQWPSLVGQFAATAQLPWTIPLSDRLTMLPWLAAIADYDASPQVYEEYDKMSARELFKRAGVSQKMYDDFLRPTLLVGLFAEGEDLSAAAVLETLYFYALQNVASFDVCWPRGSIAENIFTPMVEGIRATEGGQVLGGQVVVAVETKREENNSERRRVTAVRARDASTGQETRYEGDAFVFAVGVKGLKKLVSANPDLAAVPELRRAMALRAIDCVATRLWFDKKVSTKFPANVLAGFERSAGATFFMLDQLNDEYKDVEGSVVAADFYGASELLPLSDDAIVARVVSHLRECEPGFESANVIDSAVLRAPEAVTHFSVGSFSNRPPQRLPGVPNLFLAGDLVKGVATGANGLSQERAYVTGLSAANAVLEKVADGRGVVRIPEVARDEPHIVAAKGAARAARQALGPLLALSPLMR
jgi:uncharacterized protein with NAD-binding domain and iron-sulfur cluster